jgi:hypothetical protein
MNYRKNRLNSRVYGWKTFAMPQTRTGLRSMPKRLRRSTAGSPTLRQVA